jgi:predicted ATP-grasp superfamily ATP-dependent carboligase
MPEQAYDRPALVLGLDRTGLSLARALGRLGIPVSGIAWGDYEYGPRSRYLRRLIVIDKNGAGRDEQILHAIKSIASGERLVVFADSDASVDFILRHWDEMNAIADFPLPDDPAIVENLRAKDRLPAEGAKHGVDAPATVLADGDGAIRAAALRPPLLVKPVRGKGFELAFGRKAFVAQTVEEAVRDVSMARERGFETIVQELIPNAEQRILSVFTYIGRSGEPLLSVTGRKVRQLPVRFGSSTVFEVRPEPRALELGLKLLRGTGYRGFAHVELAHDVRDDTLKLIEVNTRAPIWASVATRGEPNIVRIAYDDLCGRDQPSGRVRDDGGVWVDLARDVYQAISRRDLRPREFVQPYLRRDKVRAIFAPDDPVPAVQWFGWALKRVTGMARRGGS